ncbi:HPF/RaiA family ribosome-associated protein [Allomuricauda sp. d1]|uniref:HPF/RaiA family ribosome-associated protein n=1 Tax=Allomuricauda sp. d1 TaxID=3136725 RepID=UPI0031E2159A
MEFVFEYVNVSASDRLETLAKEKLSNMAHKYPFVHRADVFFKKENRNDDKEQICVIRLSMPGPRIHAETKAESFENAISETVRDLTKQLDKKKENWAR